MATTIERVRLEIGDSTSPFLFSDPEIQIKLDDNQDAVLATSADLLDILANRFAREYDFETDGQTFKRGTRSAAYAARAKALRGRADEAASGGLGVVQMTRVDGESDDLSARDGAPSAADRVGCDFDTP